MEISGAWLRALSIRKLVAVGVAVLGIGMIAQPVTAQVMDAFQYPNAAEARKVWQGKDQSPAVDVSPSGGLALTLPFSSDRDRVYWDRDGAFDLSGISSLVLEVSCEKPSAMRALSIYLRSGAGWYIWSKPLSAAGRQHLILSKSDFKSEGKPAGWDKIDRIRISPWRGQALDTSLIIHQLAGKSDRVYLVTSLDTMPTDNERRVAERTAARLGRWLRQSGIPHATIPDDQLENKLSDAALIILPYNPKLNVSALKAIGGFTKRGGKLMVFFSSDIHLAKQMDVKLGEIITTRDIARLRGIRFDDSILPGSATVIHQQSWNINQASPASDNSAVVAWWINAGGEKSSDAAVIATPHGYWFTHILLGDDNLAKQRMLTALCGSLVPELWQSAAQHALSQAGRVDGWTDVDQACRAIKVLAEPHPERDAILARIENVETGHRAMTEYYRQGKYQKATETGYDVTDSLMKAYALAQTPAQDEMRGVWDHDATGWYPGNWDRTAKLLKDSGINTIFINATWAGLAHYSSRHLPASFTFNHYGDQLDQCIQAARKHGLRVHAWIVCWALENSRPEFTDHLIKTDRLQRGLKGEERLWMNPAHPDNVKHHTDIILEILERYPVDGIHLDYIRYPGSDACFSDYTRRQFETSSGRSVNHWPQDVKSGGPHYPEFIKWRADNITSVVRASRKVIKDIKPEVQLSAAVWGGYPQVILSIGQDWGVWMKEGLLDFVVPMNYANDLYSFTALVDQQLPLPGVAGKIFPGIGVTANESQLRGDQVIEQVLALRQRGIKGFVLYRLSQTLVDDTLPALRMGVTRTE